MSPGVKATALVSGLLYVSLLAEPAFWEFAFGSALLGLPAVVAVVLLVSALFAPVPWFVWHAVEIVRRGRDLGFSMGRVGILLALLTIGRYAPELRRSQLIALGGLGYGLAFVWPPGSSTLAPAGCGVSGSAPGTPTARLARLTSHVALSAVWRDERRPV